MAETNTTRVTFKKVGGRVILNAHLTFSTKKVILIVAIIIALLIATIAFLNHLNLPISFSDLANLIFQLLGTVISSADNKKGTR